MAPCEELTLDQHALFSAICAKRTRKLGFPLDRLNEVGILIDHRTPWVRNEIEGLIDAGFLTAWDDDGFLQIPSLCEHRVARILRNSGSPSPQTPHPKSVRPTPIGSGLMPPYSVSSRLRPTGSLAAPSRRVQSTDGFYEEGVREAAQRKSIRVGWTVPLSSVQNVSTWNASDLARYFGRRSAALLGATQPNYAALARCIKDLLDCGVNAKEVKSMMDIFLDNPPKNVAKPAWQVFYGRRDSLLSRARNLEQRRERVYRLTEEDRPNPHRVVAR